MTIYVRQRGYVKKRSGSRGRGSLYCLDMFTRLFGKRIGDVSIKEI